MNCEVKKDIRAARTVAYPCSPSSRKVIEGPGPGFYGVNDPSQSYRVTATVASRFQFLESFNLPERNGPLGLAGTAAAEAEGFAMTPSVSSEGEAKPEQ